MSQRKVTIVGAGYRGGQPITGVENGPKSIRDAGLLEELKELHGIDVMDTGDLVFPEIKDDITIENNEIRLKNPKSVGNACKTISDVVGKHARDGNLIVTLGGDHSLAMGSISGVAQGNPDLVVIWIDAHADINTPQTSPSGNIHGMPVAFLMGMVKDSKNLPGFEWLNPCLSPDRIAYIGLRDVDAGERKILKENNILAFSMTEVEKYGISKIMDMIFEKINPKGDRPIHLSFDVDGIDPSIVASTGTRVNGGLTFREARYICDTVQSTGKLVGVDIVEVNPSIGTPEDAKRTSMVAVDLVKYCLGHKLL